MKKVVKYIAEDGTVFNNKKLCMQYEREGIEKINTVKGLYLWKYDISNDTYTPLVPVKECLLKANVMAITTKEALDFVSETLGRNFPSAIGNWYYDALDKQWRNYNRYEGAIKAFRFLVSQRLGV